MVRAIRQRLSVLNRPPQRAEPPVQSSFGQCATSMGVALSKLIPRKEIPTVALAGQKIAIDAFNVIYFFLSVIRDSITGEPLKDRRGRVTSHLSGLLFRTADLLQLGMQPVYVFNGKYPDIKRKTVEDRREARKAAERKWQHAVRMGQPALRYAQAATHIDADIVAGSKTILELMGVPWIQAPSEGEAQCSWMCRQNLVFATASQDFDSLLFGSSRLVRNLAGAADRYRPAQNDVSCLDPELIELDEVLTTLAITREQLILVGLLIGTDYNEGVKGVGPVKALNAVKDHGTLENILRHFRFPGRVDLRKIYQFFVDPPHTADCPMEWKPPRVEQIFDFLVGQHDFAFARVQGALAKLQAARLCASARTDEHHPQAGA